MYEYVHKALLSKIKKNFFNWKQLSNREENVEKSLVNLLHTNYTIIYSEDYEECVINAQHKTASIT